ncbi:MAG: hypothetical protein RLO08_18685 [Parvibaculaceae bacterium]
MSEDRIIFNCSKCGSEKFSFPNDPPKDDDIIACAGCGNVVGKYADVRAAAMDAAKTEVGKIVSDVFGKFKK